MKNTIKKKKGSEKEEVFVPEEVVTLDDASDVIIRNAVFSINFLRDSAFCEKCHGNRIE